MGYAEAMDIFGTSIPFVSYCNIEPIEITGGETHLRVELKPEHGNQFGIAHGGLVCTLLDVAMGTAARHNSGVSVITLDMQVSFLSPGRGKLHAIGRVARAGRSIIFTEADARTEDGELVAKASGVFKTTSRKPGGAAEPA